MFHISESDFILRLTIYLKSLDRISLITGALAYSRRLEALTISFMVEMSLLQQMDALAEALLFEMSAVGDYLESQKIFFKVLHASPSFRMRLLLSVNIDLHTGNAFPSYCKFRPVPLACVISTF